MNRKHVDLIATQLSLGTEQVANTIRLLESGATIPFIARYRKEATAGLDEVQVAGIKQALASLEAVDKRRESILQSLREQEILNDALKKQLEGAWTLTALEDIYLPFKPKRKTRASAAREKGLEPLARTLFKQEEKDPEEKCRSFLGSEVPSVEEALQGARDIMAEWISEDITARNKIRAVFEKEAVVSSRLAKGKEEEGIKYKDYFDYKEPLVKCASHRILAVLRGEEEGVLKVSVLPAEEAALPLLEKLFVRSNNPCAEQVRLAAKDAYKRLLAPSIETEVRNRLKEKADGEAIKVFAENLRQLLLAPPLGPKRILAIDPGFRTGCKVVCLDEQGNLLHNETIYPHPPQEQLKQSTAKINTLVNMFRIEAIAIGNGTAGRETEFLIKKIRFDREVQVFVVNEAGASVYSASAVAREEFPEFDVTVRGAVSIGRRLADPLAELVKIDPKSIGVGQYQHDVDQQKLKEQLDLVVESCVNKVGVNLNTASKHLLTYVSGLGNQLAQNIVAHRKEHGPFASRQALKKVARMGEKAFEQSAGFLRIPEAENPLDNSAVHPESYPVIEQMAADMKCTVTDLMKQEEIRKKIDITKYISPETGLPTLTDIMNELAKPGRDPRTKVKVFEFAKGIRRMDDLQVGMVLPGIVTNITSFGAFVDIGVKQDGLVHISNLANAFVKNPADVVKLHQHVQVKVIEVDVPRKRIQLSMKDAGTA